MEKLKCFCNISNKPVKKYEGIKKYIATGDVLDNKVVSFLEVDYLTKPSRANQEVDIGDVLFAKMIGTEKVLLIDENNVNNIYSTGFFVIKPNTNMIIGKYLYWLFKSPQFNKAKDKNCKGATQKALNIDGFEKIEIVKLPSLEEQNKIVNQLEIIQQVIDIRKEQIRQLEDLIKARFVELFGDVIRNDRGWEQYIFSDIATSRLGKMLDAKQQTGQYAYPYLANFNVQWFRFEIDNLNKMDFNEGDRREFELRDGDLLVCEGGEIGRCAVWHNEIQPCYFQKALHRVRCNQHIVLPDYMAWWFKYNCDHKGFAAIEGAKATIAHLPGAKLKALKVTVPPIELQNQFVAFLKQTDKSKFEYERSLNEIQSLMDSLMQKYFG